MDVHYQQPRRPSRLPLNGVNPRLAPVIDLRGTGYIADAGMATHRSASTSLMPWQMPSLAATSTAGAAVISVRPAAFVICRRLLLQRTIRGGDNGGVALFW